MTIETARLPLVVLGRGYLASVLAAGPRPDLGFVDPAGFLAGAEDVVALRCAQIDEDPRVEPWLLRAIVERATRTAVGFTNFHAPPDAARAMVEIGYEVHPAFRRRGFAREAVRGLIAWAAGRGARVVRACVGPDNAASLAMIAGEGFVHAGEQLDEVDGRELVFEKPLAASEQRA